MAMSDPTPPPCCAHEVQCGGGCCGHDDGDPACPHAQWAAIDTERDRCACLVEEEAADLRATAERSRMTAIRRAATAPAGWMRDRHRHPPRCTDIYLDEQPGSAVPRKFVRGSRKWIKHVHSDGARFHVIWWSAMGTHCTEPDCIINRREVSR
jgi:hypothetical protein